MNAILALVLLMAVFALGEIVADKTKAILSTTLVIALVLMVSFWLGLPADIFKTAAIDNVSYVLIGILITSMGTMIDIPELKWQWKTIVVSAVGMVVGVVIIILVATLVIALGMPLDGLSWDSSLSMLSGYPSMFLLVELGITLITTVSFLVSAYSRGSREYIFIGIGSLLVLIGRNMLLGADTWLTPLPALAILGLGTWFICGQLHRVYLWL
jgi:hypothetical protein